MSSDLGNLESREMSGNGEMSFKSWEKIRELLETRDGKIRDLFIKIFICRPSIFDYVLGAGWSQGCAFNFTPKNLISCVKTPPKIRLTRFCTCHFNKENRRESLFLNVMKAFTPFSKLLAKRSEIDLISKIYQCGYNNSLVFDKIWPEKNQT